MRLPGRVPPAEGAEPVELGPMLAEPRRRALRGSALLLGRPPSSACMVWNTTTMELVQSVDDAWLDLMEALRWGPFVAVAEVLVVRRRHVLHAGRSVSRWS